MAGVFTYKAVREWEAERTDAFCQGAAQAAFGKSTGADTQKEGVPD
jgi:hypothetical protein